MSTKFRPITHIITSGSGTAKAYSKYKIVLEGTIRETGDPDRYCQWCKVGLGWNGNNPVYGSSYYTVESYDLVNGTYWSTYSESNYPPSNLFVDNLNKKIDWTYNTGHKDDCYLEVVFNTNNAITPSSIGLISTDNANSYPQRPEYFKLYGWDNGWDLITVVYGEDTTSGSNAESIFNISSTSSSTTIIRPISIFTYVPEPPFPYQTVRIGNQTWMAENLHEDDGGTGIKTVQSVIATGYEFGPQTYYSYEAAVRVANSIEGWHLPTNADWSELRTYFDGQALNARSTTGWNNGQNGTNDLGLNIQPVGRLDNINSYTQPGALGSEANLWCYNVDNPSQGKGIFFYNFGVNNWFIDWNNSHGNSVRLIKD